MMEGQCKHDTHTLPASNNIQTGAATKAWTRPKGGEGQKVLNNVHFIPVFYVNTYSSSEYKIREPWTPSPLCEIFGAPDPEFSGYQSNL